MAIQWDVLTLGCITRNRFWGEEDTQVYRHAHCTSTLIKAGENILLVDPALPEMDEILYARCGVHCADITHVFVTHHHSDHLIGIEAFGNAQWFIPPGELSALSAQRPDLHGRFTPATGQLLDGIDIIPLPGHTPGLCGLKFSAAQGTIIVAGDAVMRKDFFEHRVGYYNSMDFGQASKTIKYIAQMADIVVPGHDNYFLV